MLIPHPSTVVSKLFQRLGLRSLRSQMHASLLAPMLLLAVLSNYLAYVGSYERANAVVDQMLVGSARIIGESISVAGGLPAVDIPPVALENLRTDAGDSVYYRVDSPRFGLLAGDADLPVFADKIEVEGWRAFDASFRDKPIRAIAYAQALYPFSDSDVVVIQVVTTTKGRNQLAVDSWTRITWYQALLVIVAAVFGGIWARAALAPALRISEAVRSISEDATTGIEAEGAPTELVPLVQAINDYIGRINHYVEQQRRFISNAAHQLKTPLTILNTQVVVGIRSEEVAVKQRALEANYQMLQHCIHMTEQLLTLSAADHKFGSRLPKAKVNLNGVVRSVLEKLAGLADQKGIDLGFTSNDSAASVLGVPVLIETLAANLVDNAIRYTPNCGIVTASVKSNGEEVCLEVEDNGPGIPAHLRDQVFERYYRVSTADQEKGSGLGLAIVREISLLSDAQVFLLDRPDGAQGLLARIVFSCLDGERLSGAGKPFVDDTTPAVG